MANLLHPLFLVVLFGLPACVAFFGRHIVLGDCLNNAPHGAYTLRSPEGYLMVRGTFVHRRKEGIFHYFDGERRKLGEIQYVADKMHGPVRLWYMTGGRKLEATYSQGRLHGRKESWYEDGKPRALFEYEGGKLIAAQVWDRYGHTLASADAERQADADLRADESLYEKIHHIVAANLPACGLVRDKFIAGYPSNTRLETDAAEKPGASQPKR